MTEATPDLESKDFELDVDAITESGVHQQLAPLIRAWMQRKAAEGYIHVAVNDMSLEIVNTPMENTVTVRVTAAFEKEVLDGSHGA